MQQVVAERSPQRRLVKQLREAVRRAQRLGLPEAAEWPPPTLLAHNRLTSAAVAAATAWLLKQPGAPAAGDVAGLVDALRARYFDVGAAHQLSEQRAVDPVEVRQAANRVRAQLTTDQLYAVRARLRGESLASLGARAGIGVSSAHARVQAAIEATRAAIADVDRETGESALDDLAA
jgi:hypothetical protein